VGEGAEFGFIVCGSAIVIAVILEVTKSKKIANRKIAITGLEIFKIANHSKNLPVVSSESLF
jgi:hypothetical protein